MKLTGLITLALAIATSFLLWIDGRSDGGASQPVEPTASPSLKIPVEVVTKGSGTRWIEVAVPARDEH